MGNAMNDPFENRSEVKPENFPSATAQALQMKLNQKTTL